MLPSLDKSASQSPRFLSTRWSLVLEASRPSEGREAMEALCKAYWYPIYAEICRRGYKVADAEDLTQSFFAHLIESRSFESADQKKGRLRFYLLGGLNHFLANASRRERSLKRGGGAFTFSLDELDAGNRYQTDPKLLTENDPRQMFEKLWGETLVKIVFQRLEDEFARKGKSSLYQALSAHLSVHAKGVSYAETAKKLSISLSAVKSAVHRLRERYTTIFRQEIARTVSSESEVDDEIRYLIDCLSK